MMANRDTDNIHVILMTRTQPCRNIVRINATLKFLIRIESDLKISTQNSHVKDIFIVFNQP